jgi:phosphohistidine phosphatase SixA
MMLATPGRHGRLDVRDRLDFIGRSRPAEGAVMTRGLLLFTFAASIIFGAQSPPAAAQQSARAAFEDLKQGGYVIVIRHGRTNESPAVPKDESPLDLATCTGQLMLNDVGKEQAHAIGEAFKKAGIPVGKVLASSYCRAVEMARLAFGRAETTDALLLEAFVPAAGAPVPPPWPQRVEMMKQMIATVPDAGTNTILVTHFPNVKAALGVQINFGDAAIVKPDGHGGAAVVARIPSKEWATF